MTRKTREPNRVCRQCGRLFYFRHAHRTTPKPRSPGRFCSRACTKVFAILNSQSSAGDRLKSNVIEDNECWLWQGRRKRGYGSISVGGRIVRTHRLAYELWIG